MYVARILYPVHVLGPGKRVGIWFAGCPHRCPGCSNPELWEPLPRYKTSLDTLLGLIGHICQTQQVDGFTLTGGDPFAQPEALAQLLPALAALSDDILVYTGFELDPLRRRFPELLTNIGVLIDGPYIQERNTGVPLRGSDNQSIRILDSALEERYRQYLASAQNKIENFTTVDGVISVGIHRPGYNARLDTLLRQKGLKTYE